MLAHTQRTMEPPELPNINQLRIQAPPKTPTSTDLWMLHVCAFGYVNTD